MPRAVFLETTDQLDELSSLVEERSTGVIWIFPCDRESATRHLRGINRVRITDRRRGAPDSALEFVTFRHADASVMAQVLPSLDQQQFARLLGPARNIFFLPEDDYSDTPGWQNALWSKALPKSGIEPLTFDTATLERIERRRDNAITKSSIRYVRENISADLEPVSEEEIKDAVQRSEESARELGINTAGARQRWAWLDLVSDGNFGRSKTTRQHLARPDADHDWDMDNLVILAKKKLRDGR